MALKIYDLLAFILISVTVLLQYWSGARISVLGALIFCVGQGGLIDEMAKPHDQYRGLRLIPSALLMFMGGAWQAYQTFCPIT